MQRALLPTACAIVLALTLARRYGPANGHKLKLDQARALPAVPKGFDLKRDGIERGKLETVEYDSTTVGVKRKAQGLHPAGVHQGQEVSGPVPPPRHRR